MAEEALHEDLFSGDSGTLEDLDFEVNSIISLTDLFVGDGLNPLYFPDTFDDENSSSTSESTDFAEFELAKRKQRQVCVFGQKMKKIKKKNYSDFTNNKLNLV